MKGGPFEHFSLVTKESHRMTPWRLLTRMHETLENINSALDSVQKSESELNGSANGASQLRKKRSV